MRGTVAQAIPSLPHSVSQETSARRGGDDDEAPPQRDRSVQRHEHGTGRCRACGAGGGQLARCAMCGQKALHRIYLGRGGGIDLVCENRCSADERIQATWRAEMREALRDVH